MKTTTAKKRKAIFTASRTGGRHGEYAHFTLSILVPSVWGSGYVGAFNLAWQSDRGCFAEGREGWYGLTLTAALSANGMSILRGVQEAAKLAAKLLPDTASTSPEAVLERLASIGIRQAVYDRRVNEEVLAEHVMPSEYSRWVADGVSGVYALAETERGARETITRQWAAEVSKGNASAMEFSAWIDGGRLVKQRGDTGPEVTLAADLLTNPFTPSAVVAQ